MADKVTIQDIADALGLSRNTVSKAINNTGVLAEATRDKILRKAVEMGYKQVSYVSLPPRGSDSSPLALAGTVPEHRGVISLLTAHSLGNSHFASTMLDRLQRELSDQGYSFMTHRVSKEDIEQKQLPSSFRPAATDGILCIELFDPDYAEMICSIGKPTLFVDGPSDYVGKKLPSDLLLMDNRTEIMTFVARMAAMGVKRFAYLGEMHHCISFYERYQALKEGVFLAGLTLEPQYCISYGAHGGREKPHEAYIAYLYDHLKSLAPLPEVIVCSNDFTALAAMEALRGLRIRIPEDVMLFGFDDSPESRVITPSISTVHIHSQIMGNTAAQLLLSRIAEPSLNYRTVHTETTLLLRDSTRLPQERERSGEQK